MVEEALQPSLQNGRIEQALKQVAIEGSGFLNGDPDARERLIASARQVVAVAETPAETLLWNIWALVCLCRMFRRRHADPSGNSLRVLLPRALQLI